MQAPPRLIRSVLWAAISLAILGGWIYWGVHFSQTAWDFTMFYVAAHTPLGSLHDQAVFQATAQRVLAGTGVTYASPYVRPAVFALPLRWMQGLSYWHAYCIWALLQFVFYVLTLVVLARRWKVPVIGFYPWALFFPVFFGIITGQDALALGLVLTLALVFLVDRRDVAAGALLSLTLYKFNLFLLLPIYLLLRKRYRALAAYCVCGAALAGLSVMVERPSVYLALLPQIERFTIGFSPKTMLGLRGLCENLGARIIYPFAAIGLAAFLLRKSRQMDFARGFGLAITAGVLCAYHATWYDGAVLALPLGLAVVKGGPMLRVLAICALLIPLWNVFTIMVSTLLLAFAVLYAIVASENAPEQVP